MSRGCILVTGGAGYIGSHTLVELLQDGYTAVVVDNLNNSSEKSLKVVEELTGHAITFYELDLLDIEPLRQVFIKHQFCAVIHFAGLKAVGESMQKPFWYYQNNLVGTINLIQCLREFGVKNVVFSSSCTVYGNSEYLPIDEKHPTGGCTNPYGRTKYFIEQIFTDICHAEKEWNVVLLRYFNPVGAHPSGRLGEDPNGIPNQLMPYVAQTAVGRREKLSVFGADYNTKDGTGVRDYIHVVDLAKGHLKAITKTQDQCGLKVYNLGTGTGYSVMEMIHAFQKASGRKIPYEVVSRRPGDAEEIFADPQVAEEELGWKCELALDDMCQDLWRWQSKNPDGYGIGRTDTTTTPESGSTNVKTGHKHRSTSQIQDSNKGMVNGEIQNGVLPNRTDNVKDQRKVHESCTDERDVSANGKPWPNDPSLTNGHTNGFLQNGQENILHIYQSQEGQHIKNGFSKFEKGENDFSVHLIGEGVKMQTYTESNNNAIKVTE